MILLGVNIDHAATLRQARYRDQPAGAEPDPARAAHEAELGGADILTLHLREDRRHVSDRDLRVIREQARVRVNLEMAATDPMLAVARDHRVHMATLVPEGRQEVTTEGGLDVASRPDFFKNYVRALRDAGITPSAFIDPDIRQVAAAADAGFTACELHTGPFARAYFDAGGDSRHPLLTAELEQLVVASAEVRAAGLRCNAGHALNYHNVRMIAALPGITELHIGHAIIARALFTGLRQAVADMKSAITHAAAG